MFTFKTALCASFKSVFPILKTDVVSIRARNNAATFCFHNRATGLLFLHRIPAEVKKETEFGMGVERLLALLQRETLELSYDGSSVNYKSGRSSGSMETHKPTIEPWPDLKNAGTLVTGVVDAFSSLDLKSKTAEIFIFGGSWNGQSAVSAGDREHSVYLPLDNIAPFTLPLTAVANARRIFKDDIRVIVNEGVVFFQSKLEFSVSVLRAGQIGDTAPLSLETFGKFRDMPAAWTTKIHADIFDSVLKDYSAIEDKERTGLINLDSNGKQIVLTAKTRHGEIRLVEPTQGQPGKVILNTELLKDINKLDGVVSIGVKENGLIFFITDGKAMLMSALGG